MAWFSIKVAQAKMWSFYKTIKKKQSIKWLHITKLEFYDQFYKNNN